MLRRYDKPVIVAINKVDNKQSEDHIYDFYELGFEDYVSISGEHNVGIIDLLEKIVVIRQEVIVAYETNSEKIV